MPENVQGLPLRFISLVRFLTIQRVSKDNHLIRQFVLGQAELFVLYQVFLSCFVLVMGFIKEPITLKWGALHHLVFIETLCCVWAVYGYDRRAMFLLPNQRERCNTGSHICSCSDRLFTVFWTMTNFERKSNAHPGWVALRGSNWLH